MAENQAAAPQTGTEATPNTNTENINTQSTETAQPAETSVQAPEMDQFDKFIASNGGREKVFEKMKQAIGNPEAYAKSILEEKGLKTDTTPEVPQDQTTQAQAQPTELPKGMLAPEEFMIQQYFNSLAQEKDYANIKEQIQNGEVLKEMAKFNIRPMVNGAFNHDQVRNFLDLYNKTVPPTAPETPITATPTVDYKDTEGEVDSQSKAFSIMQQGVGHPLYAKAQEFLLNDYNKKDK